MARRLEPDCCCTQVHRLNGWRLTFCRRRGGACCSLARISHRAVRRARGKIMITARDQTPLMTAIQHSNAATMRTLIELGADARARDNQGKDSCDWARQFERDAQIVGLVCAARN